MAAVTNAVLHLTLANLKPDLARDDVDALLAEFGALSEAPGVLHLGAIIAANGSTHGLALFAYLPGAGALEAFGMDARHVGFLRRTLFGAVRNLAKVEVAANALPPREYAAAVCFAAALPPATFDWQVNALFEWLDAPGPISGGAALDHRQPYRAAGVLFLPGPDASAPDRLARRIDEAWGGVAGEQALVVGEARPLFTAASSAEKAG